MASTDGFPLRGPMRREGRLLLATAGGPAMNDAIRTLANGALDWIRFLQLTATERAPAIVAARFDRLGVMPPPDARKSLEAMAAQSNVRMAMLSGRLDRTLSAMASAGIPVVLLKGAALGKTVYGSLPRRPMLDIDLLVPPDRTREAHQVAVSIGWVATGLEKAEAFYEGHYHLAPLTDGSGLGFNLELHTGLLLDGSPFNWSLEEFWRRSRPLPGLEARVPDVADLLLHLALHFSWSHMARIGAWRTFRDLRTLADSGTVDWQSFLKLAHRTGTQAACYWMLRLARACGITEVPPDLEASLRPALAWPVLSLLERHLASQWYAMDAFCPSSRLAKYIWKLAMLQSPIPADAVLPWHRDSVFERFVPVPPEEGAVGRIVRHLLRVPSYARYLQRVVWGRAP